MQRQSLTTCLPSIPWWRPGQFSGLPDEFGCQQTHVKFLDVGLGRSELLHGLRIVGRRQFLEPGVDVLGKRAHRTHRFIAGHEASLTHHQQMSESARVLPEILQLLKDWIGSSSEDIAAGQLGFQPGITPVRLSRLWASDNIGRSQLGCP